MEGNAAWFIVLATFMFGLFGSMKKGFPGAATATLGVALFCHLEGFGVVTAQGLHAAIFFAALGGYAQLLTPEIASKSGAEPTAVITTGAVCCGLFVVVGQSGIIGMILGFVLGYMLFLTRAGVRMNMTYLTSFNTGVVLDLMCLFGVAGVFMLGDYQAINDGTSMDLDY